jgi:hypothetical protein
LSRHQPEVFGGSGGDGGPVGCDEPPHAEQRTADAIKPIAAEAPRRQVVLFETVAATPLLSTAPDDRLGLSNFLLRLIRSMVEFIELG